VLLATPVTIAFFLHFVSGVLKKLKIFPNGNISPQHHRKKYPHIIAIELDK
jgi:hypothetical protein